MSNRDNIFADYLVQKHPGRGCLIPHSRTQIVCHEREYCECEVLDAMNYAWDAREKEHSRLVNAAIDVVLANGWTGSATAVSETQPHIYKRMLDLKNILEGRGDE